jgi:hypothetical protein
LRAASVQRWIAVALFTWLVMSDWAAVAGSQSIATALAPPALSMVLPMAFPNVPYPRQLACVRQKSTLRW